MDLLTTLVQSVTAAPQAATDLETEVAHAKAYGYATLGLLVYIALKVSKR